jgi:pimeloyl-ACP methyl ester carboxylesterase
MAQRRRVGSRRSAEWWVNINGETKMNDTTPVLFLHGGPGFSSIAERELYGSELPLHWWDQPRSVVQLEDPFSGLVKSAIEEAARLAARADGKVNLLGHSSLEARPPGAPGTIPAREG